MRLLLIELYRGNIDPFAKGFKHNSDYHKILTRIVENQKKLQDMLSDEQQELLKALSEESNRLCALAEEDRFIDGFRLGARLIQEIRDESDGYMDTEILLE